MGKRVSLLLFVGGRAASAVEEMVAGAQQAAAQDTVAKALGADWCEEIIVATDSASFGARLRDWPVAVEVDDGPFHFGYRLRQLIRRYQVEHAFYMGGGSGVLLSAEELASIAQTVLSRPRAVAANNFYSTDFAAFSPSAAMDDIALPDIDNNLAWLLHYQAGLDLVPLPPSPSLHLDIDTPTDLMVLRLCPGLGPNLKAYLAGLPLDTSRLRKAMGFLTDRDAEVTVAGRVQTDLWAHLEKDLACRKRLYCEERGLRASGREERGEVRSLLGYYIDAVGPRAFFAALAQMSQAAFIDSRVLFHHWRLDLTAADRFHSDLLAAEEVVHPLARDFTLAAREATLPVILGGHSLVSGGLWALAEAAWQEKDRQ